MTPVEAARQAGIRPQVVYGYIKHNRIRSYANPAGKADLVSLADVQALAKNTRHHRPKDPTTGLPIKPKASVDRGTIISYHGRMPKERKPRAHRVGAVTEVVKNDEGEDSLVYVSREGSTNVIFEVGSLESKIKAGICFIESAVSLLEVVEFHFRNNEQEDVADSLRAWAGENGLVLHEITE